MARSALAKRRNSAILADPRSGQVDQLLELAWTTRCPADRHGRAGQIAKTFRRPPEQEALVGPIRPISTRQKMLGTAKNGRIPPFLPCRFQRGTALEPLWNHYLSENKEKQRVVPEFLTFPRVIRARTRARTPARITRGKLLELQEPRKKSSDFKGMMVPQTVPSGSALEPLPVPVDVPRLALPTYGDPTGRGQWTTKKRDTSRSLRSGSGPECAIAHRARFTVAAIACFWRFTC